jgi:hypothetical protein
MDNAQILKELRFLGIVFALYFVFGAVMLFFVESAKSEHVIQLGIVVVLVIYIIRIIFNIMRQLK